MHKLLLPHLENRSAGKQELNAAQGCVKIVTVCIRDTCALYALSRFYVRKPEAERRPEKEPRHHPEFHIQEANGWR